VPSPHLAVPVVLVCPEITGLRAPTTAERPEQAAALVQTVHLAGRGELAEAPVRYRLPLEQESLPEPLQQWAVLVAQAELGELEEPVARPEPGRPERMLPVATRLPVARRAVPAETVERAELEATVVSVEMPVLELLFH
jgi:hypothetical protein